MPWAATDAGNCRIVFLAACRQDQMHWEGDNFVMIYKSGNLPVIGTGKVLPVRKAGIPRG